MKEEEVGIVACVPCLEGMEFGFVPYKNSTIVKCENCGCRVWLGPECAKQKEKGVPVWCMKCVVVEFGPEAAQNIRQLTNKKAGE